MEDLNTIRNALILIRDICKQHQGDECTYLSGKETGNCPIAEVTEYCPIDIPEAWQIKEEVNNENK